jgi:hypothetical protein
MQMPCCSPSTLNKQVPMLTASDYAISKTPGIGM